MSPPDENNNSQSPASSNGSSLKKRDAKTLSLDDNGNPKPVKRRASKACAACRTRKVRCDVTHMYHQGANGQSTCSNCTMDGIPCVVEESKRKRKPSGNQDPNQNGRALPVATTPAPIPMANNQSWSNGLVNLAEITKSSERRWSDSSHMSNEGVNSFPTSHTAHTPHGLYQNATNQLSRGEHLRRQSYISSRLDDLDPTYALLQSASISGDRTRTRIETPPAIDTKNSFSFLPSAPPPMPKHILPGYIKPLPPRMTSADIDYLYAKGALNLPDIPLRNALLRSYLEYVHPYMPLIEVHELLRIIDDGTGQSGTISLLLFQAIMFAGIAFVDISLLGNYSSRKCARRAFFQKARVLYDCDYDADRVSLVQSLLLMTYWYETPDDQKDTWHWMGVAISLAHTIGLHRNPDNSNMSYNRKRLWKRIWWSCFMRDRLIALGMRRPTRIQNEDCDVPMLTEEDFEIQVLDPSNSIVGLEGGMIRSEEAQRNMAQMCIEKAKLSLCISHVLSVQYSVLVRNQGQQGNEGSTQSSVMLFPNKLNKTDEVKSCDQELAKWVAELPPSCQYTHDAPSLSETNKHPLFIHRSLLHMVYFTTLSALHRPQVLPAAPITQPQSETLREDSWTKVHEASREITRISTSLLELHLAEFLPTTGVTVLLPAMIIHLLDLKSGDESVRISGLRGFRHCMQVLNRLRDKYSSADYASQFLQAAVRKAQMEGVIGDELVRENLRQEDAQLRLDVDKRKANVDLQRAHQRAAMRHTPPPQEESADTGMQDIHIPADTPHHAAPTPPEVDINIGTIQYDHQDYIITNGLDAQPMIADQDFNFDDFLNVSGDQWNEQGLEGVGDMSWMVNMDGTD